MREIFRDVAGGAVDSRKGLAEAIDHARDGDTLVVWKLDRLGRSLKHLIDTVNGLAARKVSFRSLRENMDTTTSGGMIFHVFGAWPNSKGNSSASELRPGSEPRGRGGRNGGRPAKMDNRIISMARTLLEDPNASITDVCDTLRVSRATLYRHLEKDADK